VPLYEYECARCGRFEIIKKFSDPPLLTCPTCGGEVQKLFSAPAIQFKGTGWYITDYARKSTGKGGESKEGENRGGEGKGAESGSTAASGAKDGGSSSTEKSKADGATKSPTSTGGAKGSGGGGSTS
jgi:putative FmdB family regulatory protein